MRGLFERLFAPAEEPSNDPRVVIEATLAARERLSKYESERAVRMAEYARKWPVAPTSRSHVVRWREAAK